MRKITITTLSVALAASLTVWGINPALADEVATETTQESSAVEATATETKAVTTVKVPFTNADCVDKPSSDIVKTLEDAGFTNIHKMQVRDLPDNQVDKIDTVAFVDITDGNDSTDDTAFAKDQEFPSDAIVLVGYHKLENCQLNLTFDFHENWIFSTYDVNAYFDAEKLGSLEHGKDGETQLLIKPGTHTLRVENAEDSSVAGLLELSTTDNTDAIIEINCHSDEVTLEGTYKTDTTISDALEEYLPQEMARRAVVTAITNCFATDVFGEDGNTYDPEKFHAYSDTSDSSLEIVNEGAWQPINEILWQVNNIGLQNKNGVYHFVSCVITKENDKYFVTSVIDLISANKSDIQKTTTAIAEDSKSGKEFKADNYQSDTVVVEYFPSWEDNSYLVVPENLIKEDRTGEADSDNETDSNSSEASDVKSSSLSSAKASAEKTTKSAPTKTKHEPGWAEEKGAWYYYNENGEKVKDAWVDDNYYVGKNGKMVTNDWIGEYYVGSDGCWIPDMTKSKQNALRSAESYLRYMAFSYTGLIHQLEFEQYSNEDAVFAADHCGADWMEQAAKSANNYMEFMAFSRGGLIDQLLFEGFTQEQAEYGANSVGL